jgi:two-component system sensor histidine kinase/response regulator
VDNIMNATERMLLFMQEFLANQRAEQLHIKHVQVDLADVAEQVVTSHLPAAQVKAIKLTLDAPKSSVLIDADPEGVMQALENLVSNAIKFSSEGGEVLVTVHRPSAGVVKCHVSDNGPGFTVEDRTKLFRRYGRLSAQPTGDEPSTGLGLSIVKRLVDAMGGSITLADASGKGAEFIISLPSVSGKSSAD